MAGDRCGAGAVARPDLVTGVFTFAFGAALVGLHHRLTDPLAIVITAAAAIGAAEGMLLLVVPGLMIALGRPFFARPRLWAIFALLAGSALVLAGLTGRANPIPYV
jgi:hypothetical protein